MTPLSLNPIIIFSEQHLGDHLHIEWEIHILRFWFSERKCELSDRTCQKPEIIFYTSNLIGSTKKKLSVQIKKTKTPLLKKQIIKFFVTVVDSGAARSSIGIYQAKTLLKLEVKIRKLRNLTYLSNSES